MKNLILSSVLVLIASSAAQAQQAVQWRVQDGGNGHWYQWLGWGFVDSWSDGAGYADSVGGHLPTVHSVGEQSLLLSLVPSPSCEPNWGGVILLGGQQSTNAGAANLGWSWITGESWDFQNWNVGEPNDYDGFQENRLVCYATNGRWNDSTESSPSSPPCVDGLIIEWSADCNADGIVDYGQILDGTIPDANGNGVPDCCDGGGSCTPCPGDVASDGMVDGVDLAAVLSQWGTQGSGTFNADIDDSGLVDGGDLALVLGGWGPCPQ